MGDSDDEYDRKRRDKFRGERTEPYQRGEGRRGPADGEGRRREEWGERDFQRGNRNQARGDYRDYRGGGARERYSPARTHDIAPPMKRMRTDWGDDRRAGGYGHDTGYSESGFASAWQHGGGGYSQHSSYGASSQVSRGGAVEASETQPPMMSFKSYLLTQDDNITDDEAIKKYNEYKLEFKRQQLNEFFITHKDEEWFKVKYHPEEANKRKSEQTNALLNRVKVYQEFIDTGRVDKVTVDSDKADDLVKLLDAVVVRLEGGTDLDLQALEETFKEGNGIKPSHERSPDAKRSEERGEAKAEEPKHKQIVLGETNEEPSSAKPAEVKGADESGEGHEMDTSSEQEPSPKKAAEAMNVSTGDDGDGDDVPVKEPTTKRKRSYSESGSDSAEEPPSPSVGAKEPPPPGLDEEAELRAAGSPMEVGGGKEEEDGEEEDDDEKSKSKLDNGAEDISDKEDMEKMDSIPEEGEEGAEGDEDKKKALSRSVSPEPNQPRMLHRTASIFLRNLPPTITKQEVENMCRRYPGFLRVAIADPQPERRWFRRGWVTFERNVNIKDICWNLNNIRLRDCELGAIVNRDLSRRIRTVNGITVHKQVVRNDIKMSARIVHNLDTRAGLWEEGKPEEEEKKDEKKAAAQKDSRDELPSFNLSSKNPVLKNITDYLIEEASAEEDELLGLTPDSEEGQIEDSTTIYRDENLIRVLDRLILYLRIVHSVDYYNHCEYPNEDEMPNRCGIMHARGIPPSLKQLPHDEVSEYCRMFESKIASFLQPPPKLAEDDYNKLGHKDPDAEVEKFVKANTQELAKDKWLCPLSGKKFKGPDFVRKHIFNKHTEKVEEVRKEVEYFNNYLRDPKRPQLAEHPGSRQRRDPASEREGGYGAQSQPYMQSQYGGNAYGGGGYGGGRTGYGHSYGGGYQGYTQGYSRPRGGGYNRGRGGGSGEFRPVIHYRDLDAPREPEEFI